MPTTHELAAYGAIEQLVCAFHAYKALPWWTHLFRRGRGRAERELYEAYRAAADANRWVLAPVDDAALSALLLEVELHMGWAV